MAAPTSKRMPPVALNVDTDAHRSDTSPPRTPRANQARPSKHGAGKARAHQRRDPPRETFLDDVTPVDSGRGTESDPRDSHDLSISLRQGTRDSLVDNMLLSLDQFSPASGPPWAGTEKPEREAPTYSTYGGHAPPPAESGSHFSLPKMGRRRGHTHSSSQTSDHDLYNDDATPRQSRQASRRRRSNSSSNFPSALDRAEVLRGLDKAGKGAGGTERRAAAHSRGHKGKGSKSSASSSVDLGAGHGGSRRWPGLTRKRSSSFDQSHADQPGSVGQGQNNPNDMMANDRQDLMYDDFDAAPTPTVPVGPRRHEKPLKSSAFPPQPTYAPPQAPSSAYGHDSPSMSNLHPRREKPMTLGTSVVKNWATERSSVDSRPRDLPSMPAFVESATPEPMVPDRQLSSQSSAGVPKERPGFFRRVFGSSKNVSSSSTRAVPPQIPPMSLPASRSMGNYEMAAASSRPVEQRPSTPQTVKKMPPEPPPPPPLNKKPSSFFRRRKKSVSEPAVPPVAPFHLGAPKRNEQNQPLHSPVSSLRKVMNPYLQSPPGAAEKFYDTSERLGPVVDAAVDTGAKPTSKSRPSTKATVQAMKQEPADEAQPPETGSHDSAVNASADKASHQGTQSAGMASSRPPTTNDNGTPEVPLRESSRKPHHQKDRTKRPQIPPEVTDQILSRNSLERPTTEQVTAHGSKVATSEKRRLESTQVLKEASRSSNETPRKTERHSAKSTSKQKAKAKKKQSLEWVKTTPSKGEQLTTVSSSDNTPRSPRVWLEPTSSEENVAGGSKLSLPLHGPRDPARASGSSSDYKSASSLPTVQVEDENSQRKSFSTEPFSDIVPKPEDRDRAKRIFDGTDETITMERAAPYLGDHLAANVRTRRAYMELFDWSNVSILAAMRDLCSTVVLKGETQQVDRILDAASCRWCDCNPNHGFKATDVVHTICYSILLLNTDLHLAEIDQKMTRSQFIKNTLPTIRRVVADAAPDAFEARRASTLPTRGQLPWTEPRSPVRTPTDVQAEFEKSRASLELERPINRHSRRPSHLEDLANRAPTPLEIDTTGDDCGPLVKMPFQGTGRAWETQIDVVLKSFYNSIRQQRLPLHGAADDQMPEPQPSSNSLQVLANGVLRRSPSTVSKTPSDTVNSRGRPESHRLGASRWSSKTRSRPKLHSSSNLDSGRTSLDDQSSLWSPSVSSSTWSKYSFGKTQTSMSVDSLGSVYPQGDYQQSIGFANALSQAIIREDSSTNITTEDGIAPLLEDESLGLVGAPWAKEGILTHKHHMEPFGKKAKDRNWNECFAVIEKGWMRLFSFGTKGSMRQRNKNKQPLGGVVGGGNWSENAEALGSFLLRQTIASALPPPGYSKGRPHVWALSLPTGAVHLFQVGTPEIVKEFVSTANYWSARLSKEPLVGGISNIEYGWSDSAINNALLAVENGSQRPGSGPRPSLQSSIRSSMDHGNGVKPKLPGDKLVISDWSPPQQSMMASPLLEVEQLKALLTYVKNIESELQRHNELRSPMLLAFSPRHPNANKAMSNWERKSSYLLREIVKFRTYIDSLTAAHTQKDKVYAARLGDNADDSRPPTSSQPVEAS